MSLEKNKSKYFFSLAAVLVILDQITKLAVKGFPFWGINHQGMNLQDSIPVIGSFLQITYIENAGMAFGITFGVWKILLSLFSVVASVFLGIYLYKLDKFSLWVKLGIALILAGAVGNLIDRVFYGVIFGESPLFYGRVVDFIQVDIPDINFLGLYYTHFPVFNVADSCVTCGVSLLVLFHKHIPQFKDIFPPKKLENNSESPEIVNELDK